MSHAEGQLVCDDPAFQSKVDKLTARQRDETSCPSLARKASISIPKQKSASSSSSPEYTTILLHDSRHSQKIPIKIHHHHLENTNTTIPSNHTHNTSNAKPPTPHHNISTNNTPPKTETQNKTQNQKNDNIHPPRLLRWRNQRSNPAELGRRKVRNPYPTPSI